MAIKHTNTAYSQMIAKGSLNDWIIYTKRYHKFLFIVSIYYCFAFLFPLYFYDSRCVSPVRRNRINSNSDMRLWMCVSVMKLWWWVLLFIASINDFNYDSWYDHGFSARIYCAEEIPNEFLPEPSQLNLNGVFSSSSNVSLTASSWAFFWSNFSIW